MAHVIVLDSINEDVFVCGICKTVFNSLPIFLEHKSIKCSSTIVTDNNSATIVESTDLADSFYVEAATLEQNIEQSQGIDNDQPDQRMCSGEFRCTTCNKQFKKMKSLILHMKIHNEKPYQCPICGRCFNQNSHLQRHINSHRVWPGINQNTAKTVDADLLSYSCSYCDITLSNYSQYKMHLKNHLPLKKFKCIQDECMAIYDTVEGLLQHVSSSHNHLTYSCYICNANTNSLEEYAIHQASHTNSGKEKVKKKVFKCPQCDREFHKKEKLAIHMTTEDHKKVCIHCNKVFTSDKRLRLHLQIHRKLKPFQCNICSSSFHMKKYLSSHMLKHGNRQFKCTICKYMFKRSDLLQRHMRLHQSNKLFKCPFKESMNCMKEFSRSDKLKSHIKIHTKNITLNTTTK